ncbi:hypothetical protein Aab01nite_22000 [Paractinoplanes abujensis]|nr:hypothetical protein Aab01nite_22000 [Actinoplanes abujensis]
MLHDAALAKVVEAGDKSGDEVANPNRDEVAGPPATNAPPPPPERGVWGLGPRAEMRRVPGPRTTADRGLLTRSGDRI